MRTDTSRPIGMDIVIDVSSVPEHRRNDPRFVLLFSHLQASLSDPEFIDAVCIHEAAHMIYLSKIGAETVRILGARIEYDAGSGNFIPYAAGVQGDFNLEQASLKGLTLGQWIAGVAKSRAAGGVAVRELTTRSDDGSMEDYEQFLKFCAAMKATHPDITIDTELVWAAGKEAVAKDLKSQECREDLRKCADFLRPKLFGSD